MKVTMRLYRQHDLDLIYIYRQKKEFKFSKTLKYILNNYQFGYEQRLSHVNVCNVKPEDFPHESIQLHLYLSEQKDSNAIQTLKSIKRGYRNSFLKNLLRHYIDSPVLLPYLDTKNIRKEEMTNDNRF